MNGFIEEVCTQGVLIKECNRKYQEENKADIDKIVKVFKECNMNKIIFTGMGSSLYAMDSVVTFLTQYGISAIAYSAYELTHFQFNLIDEQTMVFVISQSGKSWECLEIAEKAKKVTKVVGIHNTEGCQLSQVCEYNLNIFAGKEISISNKSHVLTILVLNILAHALIGKLNDSFYNEVNVVQEWTSKWLENYYDNTVKMYEFQKGTIMYDFVADDASKATTRQACLAYREGDKLFAASWELADYAHGQYRSARDTYLAIMCVPKFEEQTAGMRMLDYALKQGSKVILITSTDIEIRNNLYIQKLPKVRRSLTPIMESMVTDTLLGIILGSTWIKDH